jgi:hypothetical protein
MEWKIVSTYLKKDFNTENLNCIKLSTVKLEKYLCENGLEQIKEVETNNINVFLKKNKDGDICLFSDNSLLNHINKIVEKINPMFVFILQMIIPMFKPIQCKIDINNLKILELFFKSQSINISNGLSSLTNKMSTQYNPK